MFIFVFAILCSAWATPATKLTGKFNISGSSFGGKVPGEIYLGDNGEFHIQLLRPSGLSILALTSTKDDVCFLFNFDSTQYQGSHEDFATLSNQNLKASELHLIFAPTPDAQPNWVWDWNNNNRKIRRLSVPFNEDETLLKAQYNQWRKEQPNKFSIHILENNWKLKANLQKRERVDWKFSCQAPEGIEVHSLEKIIESISPSIRTNQPKK
jgi:hypothetical protein